LDVALTVVTLDFTFTQTTTKKKEKITSNTEKLKKTHRKPKVNEQLGLDQKLGA
jgi:hypothetical protein